jgi:hypothetical protein
VSGALATRTSGGIATIRKLLAIADVSISQHIGRSLLKAQFDLAVDDMVSPENQ